jgi:transposase
MVDPEIIRQIRTLAALNWGSKRISKELGIARNTVKRYLRSDEPCPVQVRPNARRLNEEKRERARQLYKTIAAGNAVVVTRELRREGIQVGVRVVQRLVAPDRRATRAAEVATVRFETKPGQQMQVDFGQKKVLIAGLLVKVHLLVAVLCHSRRIFVQAFLAERGDDWREGIASAFRHFGGVPAEVLGDNARALVVARDRASQTVSFHPAYLAFCKDWDVVPRACGPYRARTKGKVESGVKYTKHSGLAGREFDSFEALEAHLAEWTHEADRRIHGTTGEKPIDRFERDERLTLRPLPDRPLVVRIVRLPRQVANDPFVNVDTVRYSVPHGLVRQAVEVDLGEQVVRIFHAGQLVATHARSFERHARVVDPEHFRDLWRPQAPEEPAPVPDGGLAALGRSLDAYAEVVA